MYSYKGLDKDFKYKVGKISAENEIEAAKKIKDEEGILLITSVKKATSVSSNPLTEKIQKTLLDFENSKKQKRMKVKEQKIQKKNGQSSNPSKKQTPSIIDKLPDGVTSIVFKVVPSMKPDEPKPMDTLEAEIQKLFKENSALGAEPEKQSLDKINYTKNYTNPKSGKALNWDLLEAPSKDPNVRKNAKLKVKPKEILMFTRRLQIMLSSGVSLVSALSTLRDTSEKNLKKVLTGVVKDINKGNPLSVSMAKYPKVFNATYVSLVSIGESSGELENCLQDIIKMKEQEQKSLKKVKTATIYPGVIAIFLVVLMLAASLIFFPKFETMLKDQGVSMPPFTVAVFAIAAKIPIVLSVLGISILVFWILKSRIPKVNRSYRSIKDKLLLKLPLVKKVTFSLYFYYFTSTVALMLKNGIRLSDTLELAGKSIDNIYIKNEIEDIGKLMIHGVSFSEAMKKQTYFEDILINITSTGEESGKMVECLSNMSQYYSDELTTTIDRVMEAVPQLLMILIGLIVGPVVIAIYLPILDSTSGAGMEF